MWVRQKNSGNKTGKARKMFVLSYLKEKKRKKKKRRRREGGGQMK